MTPSDIATSEKTTILYEATVCQITPGNANKIQADKFQFIEQNRTNPDRLYASAGAYYLFSADQILFIRRGVL